MKGFKVVDYISFPFPKLPWRNGIGLGAKAQFASSRWRASAAPAAVAWRAAGDFPQLFSLHAQVLAWNFFLYLFRESPSPFGEREGVLGG